MYISETEALDLLRIVLSWQYLSFSRTLIPFEWCSGLARSYKVLQLLIVSSAIPLFYPIILCIA